MEHNFIIGDVVLSLSGHDKNRLYVVVGIDKNNKIVIIDGRYHLKDNPKNKNPKHLQLVAHDEFIIEKVNSNIATNAEIYKLIKAHKQIKE